MTLNALVSLDYRQSVGASPLHLTLWPTRQIEYLLINPSAYPLKGALFLEIKRMADGRWLATHPQIMTHGVGATPEAAARDFQSMLDDLFRELTESEAILAPHLRSELEYLRAVLVEPRVR